MPGLVSAGFQCFGKSRFLMMQTHGRPGYPISDPSPNRILACHHGGTGWRTNRAGRIAIGELHSIRTQLVDVRRFIQITSKAPEISPTQIIYEQEYNVGLIG